MSAQQNGTRHQTAFTVSIEAREGVTTGISAHDRAHTIAVAINPETTRDDITTPGHVFPLMAREGGALVRAGHTEASVDIARKAGLNPSAVICEIMNDDGTMARLPELVAFGQRHNLKLGSIADLIAHRRMTERLVRKVEEGDYHHPAGGEWHAMVYANTVEYQEHLVLVKGDLSGPDPVMVRMHAVDLLDDMTGSPHWIAIHNAMHMISRAGRGVVVLIREHRKTALAERVRTLSAEKSRSPRVLRDLRYPAPRSCSILGSEEHDPAHQQPPHHRRAGRLRPEHHGATADSEYCRGGLRGMKGGRSSFTTKTQRHEDAQ